MSQQAQPCHHTKVFLCTSLTVKCISMRMLRNRIREGLVQDATEARGRDHTVTLVYVLCPLLFIGALVPPKSIQDEQLYCPSYQCLLAEEAEVKELPEEPKTENNYLYILFQSVLEASSLIPAN